MLRFVDDYRLPSGQLTRREWLRVGLASSLGLGAIGSARAESIGAGFGRAKSVIFVFASGGQSQLDTFDPKPNAPLDVRGDFRPIATAVPGVRFCEHLPRIAKVADRLTVVRSMSHEDVDHGSAVYLALTGRYNPVRSGNPPRRPDDMPTFGSLLRRIAPSRRFPNEAVHLNGPAVIPTRLAIGQDAGFLGRAFEPLVVGDVRSASGAIPGLVPREDMPTVRLNDRLSLKQSLDRFAANMEAQPQSQDMNRLYHQALEMIGSPRTRAAFDLDAEPPSLRDAYGRHRSGQACLLARRLVEAGLPFVNVFWNHSNRGQDISPDDTDVYGWDTHNDIFVSLKDRLLPRFDESFATLIRDLEQRGLLDQTLVVCCGEFGRAPQVAYEAKFAGASPGRKHWASVYSILVAGAGVARGAVVGESDRMGGEPVTDRYGPWDLTATLFHALGIDYRHEFADLSGRKFALTVGQPMWKLYE